MVHLTLFGLLHDRLSRPRGCLAIWTVSRSMEVWTCSAHSAAATARGGPRPSSASTALNVMQSTTNCMPLHYMHACMCSPISSLLTTWRAEETLSGAAASTKASRSSGFRAAHVPGATTEQRYTNTHRPQNALNFLLVLGRIKPQQDSTIISVIPLVTQHDIFNPLWSAAVRDGLQPEGLAHVSG